MDAELGSAVRKFILDLANGERTAINALALATLIKAYKEK